MTWEPDWAGTFGTWEHRVQIDADLHETPSRLLLREM
jgi:hypothetical protein